MRPINESDFSDYSLIDHKNLKDLENDLGDNI